VQLSDLASDWYRANARDLLLRRPGTTPWGVLVSEFMLQQTPVARVEPIWREWMERWPRPSNLAAAPRADVLRLGPARLPAAPCGCTRRRGSSRSSTATSSRRAWRRWRRCPVSAPAAGRRAFGHGLRCPVVDTNVRRVVARAVHGTGDAGPARVRADLADVDALLRPTTPGPRSRPSH
jgi:A/G-specific adenine glycosylase